MKPDLEGYVLNLQDSLARSEVELHLRSHPESQGRLEALRQTAALLALDGHGEPPVGLAERALARLKAHQRTPRPAGRGRHLPWRRLLEVAAILLISSTALGVGVSWIGKLRNQRPGGEPNVVHVVACKDNLQKIYASLRAYSDLHRGKFPSVPDGPEAQGNAADLVLGLLKENGFMAVTLNANCPGQFPGGNQPAAQKGEKRVYAYSLGYLKNGQYVGPRFDEDQSAAVMPLMADSSPVDPAKLMQSINHGGSGQNVLYCDGHIVFCPSRFVGVNSDDIYLNRSLKVAPGLDWADAVLTSGTGRD